MSAPQASIRSVDRLRRNEGNARKPAMASNELSPTASASSRIGASRATPHSRFKFGQNQSAYPPELRRSRPPPSASR
jgi:hypothetical protein